MSALTLKHFFEGGVSGADVVARLSGQLPAGGEGLAGCIEAAMDEVMRTPIDGVLMASWKQCRELQDALTAKNREPAVVPLAEHTIASTHTPTLELFYGRKRLADVGLEIELALTLKGVALEVARGRVTGLRSGECAGVGTLSLGGQPLLEKETPAIDLPGRVGFGRKRPH